MFDANDLFKKRLSAYMKEMSRYLKYIFNGHIAIALLFFIAAIAVYYQQWLAELPADFPATWIIGGIFGLLASYTPVRTLLQEPDLVFLIPAEHKMGPYFRKALFFSFGHQVIQTLFVIAALSPLYFHMFPSRTGSVYLLTVFVLFIFKAWNLWLDWWGIQNRNNHFRLFEQFIRLCLNIAVFYFIVNGSLLIASILTLLFVGIFLYRYNQSQKQATIAWDVLVEKDQHHMEFFYRLANMFTDVPHLKKRFKKRRWLIWFIQILPFAKKHTYDYLYRITFIRSGDYLGMYVRLIILGGVSIYFVPNEWMKITFALLFIYMSMFQMISLYHHYRTNIWLDIYPVGVKLQQQAVIKLLYQLMVIQVLLFVVVFLVSKLYFGAFALLIGGILFTILFMNGYVKRKLV